MRDALLQQLFAFLSYGFFVFLTSVSLWFFRSDKAFFRENPKHYRVLCGTSLAGDSGLSGFRTAREKAQLFGNNEERRWL